MSPKSSAPVCDADTLAQLARVRSRLRNLGHELQAAHHSGDVNGGHYMSDADVAHVEARVEAESAPLDHERSQLERDLLAPWLRWLADRPGLTVIADPKVGLCQPSDPEVAADLEAFPALLAGVLTGSDRARQVQVHPGGLHLQTVHGTPQGGYRPVGV